MGEVQCFTKMSISKQVIFGVFTFKIILALFLSLLKLLVEW